MKKRLSILLVCIMTISFLVACTPKEDNVAQEDLEIDIKEVHKEIKEEFGEDYIPDMSLSLDELSERTGVKKDNVEEFIAEVPMMNVHVDTFIAIKAKKDKAYDVAQTLLGYKEYLNEEAMQYPMNLAKVKSAKVVRKGDYVFFLMIGKINEIEDQESSEALSFSEGEIKRAEVIINKACG